MLLNILEVSMWPSKLNKPIKLDSDQTGNTHALLTGNKPTELEEKFRKQYEKLYQDNSSSEDCLIASWVR